MAGTYRVRQWAARHQDLLRWVLGLPLLWQLAYKLIMSNLPHDESGTSCLVCEARARKLKYSHEVVMNHARQLFCKKCGQPLGAWVSNPKCKGNGPKYKPEPTKRSPVTVFPLNWD